VVMVEEYNNLMNEQAANSTGIVVRGLRKVYFGGGLQEQVIAVKNMHLHIFENHVTAILGHNGAGKTTLISMMTGMLQPTSGTALIGNVDVAEEGFDDLRLKFGLCPQDSIVFPLLTVDEHLIFIGAIKKVGRREAKRQADELLEKLDLVDRRSHQAKTLSGGEKRKLSVLMSMMGDPKFIFLDEPTAGMDPLSRRMTWKLIQDYKQGRSIILTTHFMDEADYLSDRIAIMADGQLRICGSSLFLKSQCGVGYTLSVNTKGSYEENPLLGGAQGLEKKVTSDMVLARVKAIVPVEVLTNEDTRLQLRISFTETEKFPQLFDMLDQLGGKDDNWSKRSLTYALSVTTLDEVFVRIAREDIPGLKRKKSLGLDELENRASIRSSEKKDTLSEGITIADDRQGDKPTMSLEMDFSERRTVGEDSVFALRPKTKDYFCENLCALLQKRFRWSRWDYRAVYVQMIAPLIFMIIGLVVVFFVKIPVQPSKSMVLTELLYDGMTPVPLHPYDSSFLDTSQVIPSSLPSSNTSKISEWLLNTNSNKEPYRYAAFDFNTDGSWILFANMTAPHSVPIFLREYQNWKLREWSSSTASMTVNMFPFPATSDTTNVIGIAQGITLGITLACGMALIPGQAVIFPIRERQVKAMHQQVISGVSILAYWLSNLLHDMTLLMFPTICALILIQVFNAEALEGATNYGCVCILILLYGTAVHGLAYLLSFLFSSPTSCQALMNIILIISNTLPIIGVFLQLGKVQNWEFYLFCIRLVPSACLADGIIRITLKEYMTDGEGNNMLGQTYDLDVAGYDIIFLISESFIYFGLAVCVEYAYSFPKFLKWAALKPSNVPDVEDMEDENVKEERTDILNNRRENSSVILRGLRKVYRTGRTTPAVVAVNDLWFSVSEGEIFGFLGANGAGKTTSMLLLTGGGIVPTGGSATLLGFDILEDQSKLRRNFGFCPQSNALFDLLTGRQTLELYAKIKGIHKKYIPEMVERMLETMQLKQYADQKVGTYSGGNKRKLCVSISLIGGPRIVFLDEPSAGVDPVARRWMWKFIQDNMTGRTVLLTTHAMDEAENLCNRIGIMVNGQMRCIGTPEELKTKYVQGYILECHPEEEKEGEDNLIDIKRYVEDTFPGSDILEEQSFSIKFRIPPGKSLGSLFKIIEEQKENLGIREYALSETNLEQVFLSFVSNQVAPELLA